jgi:hypothetical protein
MDEHLEEQIAKFLAEHRRVTLVQRGDRLRRLFDEVWPQSLVRLHSVPGATLRAPQDRDDSPQAGKRS